MCVCVIIIAKITLTDDSGSIIKINPATKIIQTYESLVSHSFGVEDSGLPGCYTFYLTSWFLTFRRNVSPSSSKRKESSTLEDEGYRFFRNGVFQ